MTQRGYTVSAAQVLAALAAAVQGQRDAIQAELDKLPGLHAEHEAAELRHYEESLERERQRKAKWDAMANHYGNTWRDHPPWKPTAKPFSPPQDALDARDRPSSEFWIEYDLAEFSGDPCLTDSQKQIWRKTIREVADRGWIVRDGRRWMRLTDAGVEALQNTTDGGSNAFDPSIETQDEVPKHVVPPEQKTDDSSIVSGAEISAPKLRPTKSLSQMQSDSE